MAIKSCVKEESCVLSSFVTQFSHSEDGRFSTNGSSKTASRFRVKMDTNLPVTFVLIRKLNYLKLQMCSNPCAIRSFFKV